MIRVLAWVALLSLTCFAVAQDAKPGLAKHPPKAVSTADAVVTQADALAVFTRAEKLLRNSTKSTTKAAPIKLSGSAPITRAQTVAQFTRLYEIVKAQVKVTPRPVKYDPAVLKMSGPEKTQLETLVRLGAVGNYGPLAAGPVDKLTVAQFGDALGFFLARLAQLTHTTSTKYSPPLMGG